MPLEIINHLTCSMNMKEHFSTEVDGQYLNLDESVIFVSRPSSTLGLSSPPKTQIMKINTCYKMNIYDIILNLNLFLYLNYAYF